MPKLETLLAAVEHPDKLEPLNTLGERVVPELLGRGVGTSTVYRWADHGLETISTNGDGTGQRFTTRRWLLAFWCGQNREAPPESTRPGKPGETWTPPRKGVRHGA